MGKGQVRIAKAFFILALLLGLLLVLLLASYGSDDITGMVKEKNQDGLDRIRYYISVKTNDDVIAIQVKAEVYYSVNIGQRCTFTMSGLYPAYDRVKCKGE